MVPHTQQEAMISLRLTQPRFLGEQGEPLEQFQNDFIDGGKEAGLGFQGG